MQFADFYFKCEFIVHYRWLFISGSVTLCIPSSGGNCNGPVPTLPRRWELLGQGWGWEYLKARHAKGGGCSHLPSYTLGASPVLASTLAPLPRAWVAAWTPLAAPPAGGALRPVSRWGRDGACALKGLHPHFLVAERGAATGLLRGPRGRALSPGLSPVTWGRARQVPGRRPRRGSVWAPSAADAEREPGAGSRRASGELRGPAPGVLPLLPSPPGAPEWVGGGRWHRAAPRFPGCALRVGEGEEFHSRGFRGWGSLLLQRSWSGWWPWTESRGRRAPAGG